MKKTLDSKVKCPCCDGTGSILKRINVMGPLVRMLKRKGLTHQAICKITGLASVSTVDFYLKGVEGKWRLPRKK